MDLNGNKIERNSMKISVKYSSLKNELTQNNIAMINMDQFNNEYNKSKIHLETYFRKEHYPNIDIEHLLSLMTYCNYTKLQNKFSETYYKNINKHNTFYNLGKNIKISIHQFGTEITNGNIQKFYHGINKRLIFPQIVCHHIGIYGRGISINLDNWYTNWIDIVLCIWSLFRKILLF